MRWASTHADKPSLPAKWARKEHTLDIAAAQACMPRRMVCKATGCAPHTHGKHRQAVPVACFPLIHTRGSPCLFALPAPPRPDPFALSAARFTQQPKPRPSLPKQLLYACSARHASHATM